MDATELLLAKAREYELMAVSFADAAALSDENAPSAIGFTVAAIVLREITPAQYEQLTGFLDAERLGLVDRVYTTETARRRRKLAREIGVAASDGESEPLDASLDDLLAVPRSAWAG